MEVNADVDKLRYADDTSDTIDSEIDSLKPTYSKSRRRRRSKKGGYNNKTRNGLATSPRTNSNIRPLSPRDRTPVIISGERIARGEGFDPISIPSPIMRPSSPRAAVPGDTGLRSPSILRNRSPSPSSHSHYISPASPTSFIPAEIPSIANIKPSPHKDDSLFVLPNIVSPERTNIQENKDETRVEDEDEIRVENEDEIRVENEDEIRVENEDEIRVEDEDEIRVENEDEIRVENEDETRVEDEESVIPPRRILNVDSLKEENLEPVTQGGVDQTTPPPITLSPITTGPGNVSPQVKPLSSRKGSLDLKQEKREVEVEDIDSKRDQSSNSKIRTSSSKKRKKRRQVKVKKYSSIPPFLAPVLYAPEIPNYANMSPLEQEGWRTEFTLKFRTLERNFGERWVNVDFENEPLEVIHAHYERYLRHIHICSSADNYRGYLLLYFLVLELVATRILGLPANGYTMAQMKSMTRYERLLLELGEKYYTPGGGEWPIEYRILFISLFNMVIFIAMNWLSKYIGEGMSKALIDSIVGGTTDSGSSGFLEGEEENSGGGGLDLNTILTGLGGLLGNNNGGGGVLGGLGGGKKEQPQGEKKRKRRGPQYNE